MEKHNDIKIASILGVVGNLFLLIIKGIIGIISNSQAMVADSFNSAGDILSSLMTYIGNKIASKPSDDDHNLGHGKAEYIYSLLISIAMIFVSIFMLKDSITRIIIEEKYDYSIWLIIVCFITIITKVLLYIYTNKLSKKYNNLLIKANSKDHINDCIITTFTLISIICSKYNLFIVDSLVGILIVLWMMRTSILIFIESYNVLMDKSMSEEEKEKIFKIINSHKEIIKVNHFNSTPVGYKYQISLTIFVDGNLSTFESHKIADELEKEIIKKIDEVYLAVIHVNPTNIGKENENK